MNAKPSTVLCFGEALWDLLPQGPQLGGAPLNLAYRLHGLGNTACLVTRVGRDEYGQLAVLRMAELGMDTSLVQYDDQRATGAVDVRVDDRGQPDFTIRPDAAYDKIEISYELLDLAPRVDCLCYGTLALRTAGSRTALQRLLAVAGDVPRFLDLNLRRDCYTWASIEDALGHATMLKLNEDEARRVGFGCELPADPLPTLCSALLDRWHLSVCLVTLGERGVFAASADGTQVYVPGYAVEVADTCGSGDAFSAGFLHAHLRGQPLGDACQLGNVLGSLVAMQHGATEPLRTAMIPEFQATHTNRIRDGSLARWEAGGTGGG